MPEDLARVTEWLTVHVIVTEPATDGEYYGDYSDRTTAHTIDVPSAASMSTNIDAALTKWLEYREPSAMWVFTHAPHPFDHAAAVKAWKDKRDAEALAANANEARARKPEGFRDRELEAEKARVRRLEAKLREAEETQARRNDIARNWERTASTYTPRALRAEALLREHGIPVPGEDLSRDSGA